MTNKTTLAVVVTNVVDDRRLLDVISYMIYNLIRANSVLRDK